MIYEDQVNEVKRYIINEFQGQKADTQTLRVIRAVAEERFKNLFGYPVDVNVYSNYGDISLKVTKRVVKQEENVLVSENAPDSTDDFDASRQPRSIFHDQDAECYCCCCTGACD